MRTVNKNQKDIELEDYYNQEYGTQAQQVQDYYNLAEEQRYSELLDTEIELERTKQNALKYTQNQIKNQGLGGSGYGSSLSTGIYNQYLGALSGAESDYNLDVAGLKMNERNELNQIALNDKQQRSSDMANLINQSTSLDNLNQVYKEYGFGDIDKEGNFVFGKKPDNLSESEWINYQLQYNNYKDVFNNVNQNQNSYSLEELGDIKIKRDNGKIGTIENNINENVLNRLGYELQNNKFTNGDTIHLYDGKDSAYLKYENGRFVSITEDDYNQSTNKYKITKTKTEKE